MSKRRGRPIMAAIFGFLTGLFAAVSLLAFGVIPIESILVTILPIAGLVIAFSVAMWAPIGSRDMPVRIPDGPPGP
ncbi:MAG: NAD(P)(+) transhydrogenase (Re/Si-specific) subunit beta [bacterium]|nr:NAD(P)(+) transhydrogenase (Re/Si-specific) subunit beta [bacterium]